jgi:hypothetical protein
MSVPVSPRGLFSAITVSLSKRRETDEAGMEG